jgi:hypothetical protein
MWYRLPWHTFIMTDYEKELVAIRFYANMD